MPFLLHRGQAILAFSDGEPKKIEQTVLLLTRIGGVIKLGQFEMPENYPQALIDDLKRRGLKVQRAIVESLSSGQIRVCNPFPNSPAVRSLYPEHEVLRLSRGGGSSGSTSCHAFGPCPSGTVSQPAIPMTHG